MPPTTNPFDVLPMEIRITIIEFVAAGEANEPPPTQGSATTLSKWRKTRESVRQAWGHLTAALTVCKALVEPVRIVAFRNIAIDIMDDANVICAMFNAPDMAKEIRQLSFRNIYRETLWPTDVQLGGRRKEAYLKVKSSVQKAMATDRDWPLVYEATSSRLDVISSVAPLLLLCAPNIRRLEYAPNWHRREESTGIFEAACRRFTQLQHVTIDTLTARCAEAVAPLVSLPSLRVLTICNVHPDDRSHSLIMSDLQRFTRDGIPRFGPRLHTLTLECMRTFSAAGISPVLSMATSLEHFDMSWTVSPHEQQVPAIDLVPLFGGLQSSSRTLQSVSIHAPSAPKTGEYPPMTQFFALGFLDIDAVAARDMGFGDAEKLPPNIETIRLTSYDLDGAKALWGVDGILDQLGHGLGHCAELCQRLQKVQIDQELGLSDMTELLELAPQFDTVDLQQSIADSQRAPALFGETAFWVSVDEELARRVILSIFIHVTSDEEGEEDEEDEEGEEDEEA